MRRSVLSVPGADGAELIAVVHEPAGPPTSVTLLLAGGVLPRMGVNRVLVRMADRLAAAGHRAVRVDPAGLGSPAARCRRSRSSISCAVSSRALSSTMCD